LPSTKVSGKAAISGGGGGVAAQLSAPPGPLILPVPFTAHPVTPDVVKVAEIEVIAEIVSVQVAATPELAHAPPQPANVAVVAVSVKVTLPEKFAEHVPPDVVQVLIPAGLLETEPPMPVTETVTE
jgi:hypothetical protein